MFETSSFDSGQSFDVNCNLEEMTTNADTIDAVSLESNSSCSLIRYNQSPNECLSSLDSKLTLKARFAEFCLKEDLADVHFVVNDEGRERRVPSHKLILAAGSDVFRAMFYGLLSNPSLNEVNLPDVDYIPLTKLLRYLYTDEAKLDASSLAATLYVAKKYQVFNLERECINFMSWNLSSDCVLMVFSQAVLYDERELMDLCLEKLYWNASEIINTDSFLDIDYNILSIILKKDELQVKEVELYKAVIRWSMRECERREIPVTAENQRLVLGEALYDIRFPLMTGDEFAFNVANQQILSKEEEMSVFAYFANPRKSTRFNSKRRYFYKTEPNNDSENKEVVLTRFSKVESGRICMFDQIHKIDFLVTKPILISGFGVYGTRCPQGDRILNIELTKADTNESLATAQRKVTCTGKPHVYQIRFKVPVVIDSHTIYTASAEFDGCFPYPTFYGINGKRIFSLKEMSDFRGEDVTFIFFKSEKSFLDTGGEMGQIPQILFYLKK
ncbi:hypothetical protein B4U79_12245 [Dinothrombium tinctorium]|uniref:BTB domain-containing protein n=1 Tax=Dinothrombium tinctorium TaxID=1965070 RepID=A0A443QCB1_9ACAR|nr:hypothetical protein B4U79_07791 [Dinothrombium tinctorium]RWS02595.1 hypothetical protein B4U79_12245 [Dinothrombium tinctorium]